VPRRSTARAEGVAFHVMNRAVQNVTLFTAARDYECFLRTLSRASGRFGIDLFAFCAMPNHWHLVVRPHGPEELPEFMRWVTQTHAQRWRLETRTTGRGAVYQGRYRWVPIQQDRHFLHVCRYVERNPLRAALVARAEQWPWSSAHVSVGGICTGPRLADWPVLRLARWADLLNEPQAPSVLGEIRRCVRRNLPYGGDEWCASKLEALELTSRARGRPERRLVG
jgi:putative transposase